ncbi:M16 family metallopeptidase [Rhodovulum sp. DZ06]|uniref:M16 family metallopeptidase n=1 Tax=Rhodovulum sp. DZ06 TaxID=3425126 RepID=UPI003D34E289
MSIPTRHFTRLPNGAMVLSEHAPQFQRIALAATVLAGSVHEPPEKAGLAHVLEHVIFRGGPTLPTRKVQEEIQELGGAVNGRTHMDRTSYTATVLREDAGRALDLFAGILRDPALSADDLELEKSIVGDEDCRGCWGCTMQEAYYATAYPDQRLSLPTMGYEETVEALTAADLAAFHEERYVGANMVVAICGDLEHDAAVEMVAARFGDMEEGAASAAPDFTYAGGETHLADRSDNSALWIGFDATHLSLPELWALDMFMDMLGGGGQSALMQELREKRGLVYSAGAALDTVVRRESARIHLSGASQKIGEISAVALDLLGEMAARVDPDVLARTIRTDLAAQRMRLDSLEARVEDMATDMSDVGRVSDLAARFKGYRDLTPGAVEDAARKMLATPPTLLLSGPLRGAPKFADLRARIGRISAPVAA